MKNIILFLLVLLTQCHNGFLFEIEQAFLRFDQDNDGFVQKIEILNALAEDVDGRQQMKEMEKVVERMLT